MVQSSHHLKEQVYEKDSVYIDTVSELKGNTEDSLSIKRMIGTTVSVPHKKLFLTQIAGNGQTILRPDIIKQSTSMQLKMTIRHTLLKNCRI